MKVLIYILCYDDLSEKISTDIYQKYKWAKILRMTSSTKELESNMYFTLFDSLTCKNDNWESMDYIGTLSWKAYKKVRIENIDKIIYSLKDNTSKPFISFFNININSMSMLAQAACSHKHFIHIWFEILKEANFASSQIFDPRVPFFACNYWMCTPEIMKEYQIFLKKIKEIVDNKTNPVYRELFYNSGYNGLISTQNQIQVFGKPYYTYHPFLYERMPGFFYYKKFINPADF